ncbi:MAG: hypothetical protein IKH78_02585 [Ruminococcus sp.]|nr:hypothetical protein [Ruminococcus sp.]
MMQEKKEYKGDPLAEVEAILRGEALPPPVPAGRKSSPPGAGDEAVNEDVPLTAEDREDIPGTAEEKEERELTPEEKVAEMFALAGEPKRKKKSGTGLSSLGAEVFILEFISVFIYFLSLRASVPDLVVLLAVLMPVIVGIGVRVLKQQLTLKEAVSKCKLHIALTSFFLLCIILSAI